MILGDLTARQMYEAARRAPARRRFGFGTRPALLNVDLQRAYTDLAAFPATAYETDPAQTTHVNRLAALARARGAPVIWTFVAFLPGGEDCGVWGTRSDTPDSLQRIAHDSPRAELDPRLELHPGDVVLHKRMASAFFETHLPSLLTFHRVDTVIVTGGSTSGCVRATAVDALSRGYRVVVPEECVADRHESPHFASLYDLAVKYADVLPTDAVARALQEAP